RCPERSSSRPLVDHEVDRPGVEARQRAELTGTNRSCGLTTLFLVDSSTVDRNETPVGLDASPALRDRDQGWFFEKRSQHRALLSRDSPGGGFCRPVQVSGGFTGGATPVPIPNTEVKPSRADGTAGETLWESRTLPGLFPAAVCFRVHGGIFFW